MKKIVLLLIIIFNFLLLASCSMDKKSSLIIEYDENLCVGEKTEIIVTSNMEGDSIIINNLTPDIIEVFNEEVTALSVGVGIVEVCSSSGTVEKINIYVSEMIKPIKIELSIDETNLVIEKEYQLNVNILPDNANKEVVFSYSRSALTIDEKTMKVVFHQAGKTYIFCYCRSNRDVSFELEVDVDFNPEYEIYDILYIGNSLTKYHHDIPAIVCEMMKEKNIPVNCTVDNVSYQYIADHEATFNRLIETKKYTHVILQEKSNGAIVDFYKFRDTVLKFKSKISDNGAQLVLYQTWAYNDDSTSGYSKQSMYEGIRDSYQKVAELSNAIILPSGTAFINFENIYGLDPSLYEDINHPSKYGAFLSACVHYAKLTGRKASEVEYIYSDISKDIADKIKEIADLTVFNE